MNKFQEKLLKIQKKNNSLVCVGLDTDLAKIPKHLLKKPDPIFEFNKVIIDATHDLVCAYKPNIAFYEAEGVKGLQALRKTCKYLRKNYPEILMILDAKRGDIESTNIGYVKMVFGWLGVDAVTLHPFLGKESLRPFLTLKDKFFFILCKTSNPGAAEFQDLSVCLGTDPCEGPSLFEYVAKQVVKNWNSNDNCGLVVGATYPKELKEIREIVGDMVLLIPGVGNQGGDIEKTVKAGKDNKGGGMIINSSRTIIFVSKGRDFAEAARKETEKLKNLINKYR